MTTQAPPRIPDDIAARLVDPTVYADNRLHDTYAWLRAHQPFAKAFVPGYRPFWVVTKHADILDISRRNATFHNGDLSTVLGDLKGEAFAQAVTGTPHLVRSLVQMDAPDHPKYRALAQGWFMPANIKGLENEIRQIARKAVERLVARGSDGVGSCDFVGDVSLTYPLHVIMSILGVPEADEPRMLHLTQQLFGPQDPDMARAMGEMSPEQTGEIIQAVVKDFSDYFAVISADRRANPRDDLATVIAKAVIDGEPISEFEAAGYYIIVATAGHDTTSSSSAGAMAALANDPALFARVKADPSLIPAFVDEAIRWTTPVKTFMRTAIEDAEVNGRHVSKGDWIMLCYASGNRDEEVFDHPFTFDIDRKPNKQLAFGYGAHLCLGQHLAKMEMRILFEELLPRLKAVRPNGPSSMVQSCFVNGLKTLPLAFEFA
jgi:hypothetical protein